VVSKDKRWYVINGLSAGNHVVADKTATCTSSPAHYSVTVPPDAEGKNFSFNFRSDSPRLPFLSLLLSKKTIFWDDLSEDPTICYFDCAFASDFGWRSSLNSKWEWGQPTCGSLTGGHTGPNAISYNSDGYYNSDIVFPVSLRSPIIDCSAYENVTLEFWRWLEVEPNSYDQARIEISNGDGMWYTIWSNPNTTIWDAEWTRQVIDISAWAAGEPTVTIRWVMGPTDGIIQYCGWNIDDIRITGQ
jgi:hypothetical protein